MLKKEDVMDLDGKKSLVDAVGLSQKNVDEIATLAAALYQEGRTEAALKLFQGLTCLEPGRADFWSALGAVLTRLERHEQAIPVLNLALVMNPNDTAALVNRAESYIALGENQRSAADLIKAIVFDPQQNDPAANRARQLAYGMHQFFEECRKEELDSVEVD